MNVILLLREYLSFRMKAISYRSMHSPYLFELFQAASGAVVSKKIKRLNRKLRKDYRVLHDADPGAGSRLKTNYSVSAIARRSAMPLKRAAFLAALARHANSEQIIEMGTSLGLSTLAFEHGISERATIYTIEGNPSIASVAAENFRDYSQGRIKALIGLFDDHLPALLDQADGMTMIIVDGDHTEMATLRYFHQITEKLPEVIIVLDDIRWSEGMHRAWEKIIEDKGQVCIDCFLFGIIIRKEGLSDQYFRLKY